MEFNHRQLPDVFDNVEHLCDMNDHEDTAFHCSSYSVKGDDGKQAGEIAFGMGKIDILVSGEFHKFFSSSLPIETLDQLKSDLARAGLTLRDRG